MEKNLNIFQERKEFKELIYYRDSLRLILELRTYETIIIIRNEKLIDKNMFFDFSKNFKGFFEKIDRLIEAAKNGLFDLILTKENIKFKNLISYLKNNSTPEENKKVSDIVTEIDTLEMTITRLSSFTYELMWFYRFLGNLNEEGVFLPTLRKELNDRIKTLLGILPYDEKSPEWLHLLQNSENPAWFRSYFNYDKDIAVSEQIKSLDYAILLIRSGSGDLKGLDDKLSYWQYAGMISGEAGLFMDQDHVYGVVLKSSTFTRLLEDYDKNCDKIVSIISPYLRVLPFSLNDYFTEFLNKYRFDENRHLRVLKRLIMCTDAYDVFRAYFDVLIVRPDEYHLMSLLIQIDFEDMDEYIQETLQRAKSDSEFHLQEKRLEVIKTLKLIAKKQVSGKR